MFSSCFHAFTSLRIKYWCIYEPKLMRIASKMQQIFKIDDKTRFFVKNKDFLIFRIGIIIYLSKLILSKKAPDLAFSDIILKHIQRWTSH